IPNLKNWHYYDFTAPSVGGWADDWFDFPEMALGKDFLYITTNAFTSNGTGNHRTDPFARAVIMRLPLKDLKQNVAVTPTVFSNPSSFSLRPTHGARDGVMFFGGHNFDQYGHEIEVLSWPEDSQIVDRKTLSVDAWPAGSEGGYRSTCKDGTSWLMKADARMTAAWATPRQVGFAWSVDSGGPYQHPNIPAAL